MTKRFIVAVIVVFLLALTYVYNNFFSRGAITGTYINYNYNETNTIAEIPDISDTLTILKNGSFKNGFWGTGTYKITYSLKGTEIDFIYNYKYGKAEFSSVIKSDSWINPKIMLNSDINQYYKKIE